MRNYEEREDTFHYLNTIDKYKFIEYSRNSTYFYTQFEWDLKSKEITVFAVFFVIKKLRTPRLLHKMVGNADLPEYSTIAS